MKGIAPAVLAAVVLIGLLTGTAAIMTVYRLIVPPVIPVEYKGEIEDAFLPTEAWFAPELTLQTACNIRDDVLGKDYTSCIFRTSPGFDSSAADNNFIVGKSFEASIVVETDDVAKARIETERVPGVTAYLKKFEIWTHEDEPSKIEGLVVEDRESAEGAVILPEGGEYVFLLELQPYGVEKIVEDETIVDPLDAIPKTGTTYGSPIVSESEVVTHWNTTSNVKTDLTSDQYTIDYTKGEVTITDTALATGADIKVIIDYKWTGIDLAAGDDLWKIDIELEDTAPGADVDEGHLLIESG